MIISLYMLLACLLFGTWRIKSASSARFPEHHNTSELQEDPDEKILYAYVSICLVVKNELDLHEWLTYHHAMGVGKVYVFDLDGQNAVVQSIREFVSSGFVEYSIVSKFSYPTMTHKHKTAEAFLYDLCLRRYASRHQFMGFLDADEYLAVPNQQESIAAVLRRYEAYGALALNWRVFGSSGHVKRPSGGVMANYHKCYASSTARSIVNTKYATAVNPLNPLEFLYKSNKTAVHSDFTAVAATSAVISTDLFSSSSVVNSSLFEVMYINHYSTKSREDFSRVKPTVSGCPSSLIDVIDSKKAVGECALLQMPTQSFELESKKRDEPVKRVLPKFFNIENKVLAAGIADYKARLAQPPATAAAVKELLCVTFASSAQKFPLVGDNMLRMGSQCSWALVYYDDDQQRIAAACDALAKNGRIVHCAMFPLSERSNSTVSMTDRHLLIPKSVLYSQLLPYLSNFRRVFLIDEDISLSDFSYHTLRKLWDCAFSPPSLIVQPLVAESTQHFDMFNAKGWVRWRHKKTVACASGYIEQQVPLMDSRFFEWYVRHVLSHTYEIALRYGTDWGFDRTWCNAARAYATSVLGHSNTSAVCAVMPGGTMVHHLEGRTSAVNRHSNDWSDFHSVGSATVRHYITLFPNWVQRDNSVIVNPLRQENTKRYPRRFKGDGC